MRLVTSTAPAILADVRKLVKTGRFFSVTFIKRSDGSERTMLCRTGVHKHLTGGGAAYDAADHDLLTVWESGRPGRPVPVGTDPSTQYRAIPIDGILRMRVDGVEYTYAAVRPEIIVTVDAETRTAAITCGSSAWTARVIKKDGRVQIPVGARRLLGEERSSALEAELKLAA